MRQRLRTRRSGVRISQGAPPFQSHTGLASFKIKLRLSRPLPTDRLDQKWRAYICQNGSVFGLVHCTQVILVDGAAYSPAQPRACHLVESKMYSAVNARVGDVVGNLLKRGVLQDYAGHRGV